MSEPTVASRQIMEKIFDEAAISYDCVGPSIFTRFGGRLFEHMPLASRARMLDTGHITQNIDGLKVFYTMLIVFK